MLDMELNPYEAPRADSNPPLGRSASRLPSKVSFACESCGWKPWNGQLYRRRAVCKRCQDRSWALTASYTEREVSIGLLGLLTTGRYFAVDEYTNQITLEKVNPNVVIELLEDRRLMLQRVSAYVTLREQERLRERGAIVCKACGALFVPAESKTWNEHGYCSKACAAEDDLVAFQPAGETKVVQQRVTVRVTCPAGHEFEQLASFSGCLRPCPECGAKCHVP